LHGILVYDVHGGWHILDRFRDSRGSDGDLLRRFLRRDGVRACECQAPEQGHSFHCYLDSAKATT
jgi:hypothetical protein